MYSKQKNIQILVSLLKQYGVRDVVISPGSRNMGFVRSIENDGFFRTHSVVDERSAAYYAAGVWLKTGQPVALSSTSAQATRNYIPGMTEAYYRGTPLVFITGDYRDSAIGQGVMQTLEQTSIPKDSAKYSTKLPLIRDSVDERHCARLVNEALLELDHHGTGPVHIDIPTEEHWGGGVDKLPVASLIRRHTTANDVPSLSNKKVLLFIGQHTPFSNELTKAIDNFVEKYNAVVYASPLSNHYGKHVVHGAVFMTGMDMDSYEKYKHDVVITIGGQHGDYGIDNKLKAAGTEHWRVHQDGTIRDTYGKLTNVFEMSELAFFNAYAKTAKKTGKSDSYYNQWKTLSDNRSAPDNLPLSHAYVAKTLMPKLPEGSEVHFGILSSLRNWSMLEPSVRYYGYSNVAGFGIDGGMSTFIGHSVASDDPTFLVIGDLSFFYDMNSLGLRQIKSNARIVLVNNNGGGEFTMYSHAASEFGEQAKKHIAAAGHNGSAQAWAESVGWKYISVTSKEEFDKASDKLVGKSSDPMLVEVKTNMPDDSDGVKLMVAANAHKSLKAKIVSSLSPAAKRRVKSILKR